MWTEVGNVMDQEERNGRRRNDVLGERDRECGCRGRNGEEATLGLRDEENGRKRREEVAGVEDCRNKCHHDHERENLLSDILDAVENIEECTCDEIQDLLEDILDAIENLAPDKHEEEALEHALCIILKKLADIDENTEAINQKLNAVLNLLEKLLCRLDKIIDIL